jgi:hypothetical protein
MLKVNWHDICLEFATLQNPDVENQMKVRTKVTITKEKTPYAELLT